MASTNIGTLKSTVVLDNSQFRRAARQTAMSVKVMKQSIVSNLGRITPQLGGSVAAIGAVGVAAAGVAVTLKLIKTAFDKITATAKRCFRFVLTEARGFNKEMHSSLAIMGKVSTAMKGRMSMAALKMSYDTKFSAKEGAAAYYYLTSAGLNPQQSIAALPTVGTFAQAGDFDLSRATTLMAGAQGALGLKVKDPTQNLINMTRVGDVLVKANVLDDASVEQYSEALTNKAGAALRLLNKDIEEGVAVLAVYAGQNIKSAEAGTALGIVLRDLQTKAIKHGSAFRAAGVRVYNTAGKMRNMADIVADLEHKLGGLSDIDKKSALLDLGFSDKSVSFIQSLIGTSDKIRNYESALREAKGTMAEVASKQLPALTRAWEKIKAIGETVAVIAIVPILDYIGESLDKLIPSFEKAANAIKLFAADTVYAFRTAYEWAVRFAQTNPVGYFIVPDLPKDYREKTNQLWLSMSKPFDFPAPPTISILKTDTPKTEAKAQIAASIDAKAQAAAIKEGKKLALSLRKPFEVFRDSVANLKNLLDRKAITPEIYSRGLADAQKTLNASMPTPETTLNAAIERGSQQAYMIEARERAQQWQRELLRMMLSENDKQTRLLREIAVNTAVAEGAGI